MSGIGIDIVDNDRIRNNENKLCEMILSEAERKMFNSFNTERGVIFLSGRFAAKEAIIKCLSGLESPDMRELDIYYDHVGCPRIDYKDYKIQLSISHEKKYSIAIAIMG